MYNLFNEDLEPASGHLNLSVLNVIKGNISRELNKLIEYFHQNTHAVNSGHFLIHILNNLPVTLQGELENYYFRISDMAGDLSRVLKLTSSIHHGKIFDGIIYGKGTQEIFISVAEDYSNYKDKNWFDLQPIKVISHPRTSIYFNPLKSEGFEGETGLAVFTIDIPMLMIQYRCFRVNEKEIDTDGAERTMMQFLAMFALPNILYSHLDVALFNRLTHWHRGNVPVTEQPRFPIALNNYVNQLDRMLLDIDLKLKKSRKDFNFILKNIPAISHECYLDVIRIPPMAITRHVKWAMLFTRLPTLRFLVSIVNESGYMGDREEKNEIRRQLRELKNDRAIQSMVDPNTYRNLMAVIDYEILPAIK